MIEMMDDNLINDITQDIIVEANLNYLFVFDLGLVEDDHRCYINHKYPMSLHSRNIIHQKKKKCFSSIQHPINIDEAKLNNQLEVVKDALLRARV